MDKEMIYLIGQIVSIITFVIALKSKMDVLTEQARETKEIVVEIREKVIELDKDNVRKDEKLKRIETVVFGPKERKDS